MRNIFLILSLSGLLIACGGVTKKSDENTLQKKAKVYTKNIYNVNAQNKKELNSSICPSQVKTLKNKKWPKLVDYANSCVQKKQWKMLELISEKLSEVTSYSPWGPYYSSIVAERKQNYHKAFWLIDLAIKRSPQLGLLHYQRARLLWNTKKYNESVEDFEKSIALNINTIEPHLFLAKVYLRDKELALAEKQYLLALKIDSGKFDALVGMAKILHLKGESEKELSYLERANRVKPRNNWVKKQLSKLVAKAGPRGPAGKKRGKQ